MVLIDRERFNDLMAKKQDVPDKQPLPETKTDTPRELDVLKYMVHKRHHYRLNALLRLLKEGGLEWNSDCELKRGDRVVKGTHITDLIKYVICPGKTDPPIGFQEFDELMEEMKIPLTLRKVQTGGGQQRMTIEDITKGPPPNWRGNKKRKRIAWLKL